MFFGPRETLLPWAPGEPTPSFHLGDSPGKMTMVQLQARVWRYTCGTTRPLSTAPWLPLFQL